MRLMQSHWSTLMELNSTQVLPLSNHSLAFAPSFVLSFVPLFRRVSLSLSLPLALSESFSPFSLSLSCTLSLSLSPILLFSHSLSLSYSLSYILSLLYSPSLTLSVALCSLMVFPAYMVPVGSCGRPSSGFRSGRLPGTGPWCRPRRGPCRPVWWSRRSTARV